MSIFLTCSPDVSGCSLAEAVLSLAGVGSARPCRAGSITAHGLTEEICDAYGAIDILGGSNVAPGPVWQALSAELLLANHDQGLWGWADPRNIHLLTYWRDFDPRFRFILIYSSAKEYISRILEGNSLSDEQLETAIRNWEAYNSQILRFYATNTERCVLVNHRSVADNPSEFLAVCSRHFGVDLKRINHRVENLGAISAFASHAAGRRLADRPDLDALFDEMESTADIFSNGTDGTATFEQAWDQYRNLARDFEESRRALVEATQQGEALSGVVSNLRGDVAQLGAEVDRLSSENNLIAQENKSLLGQIQEFERSLENFFKMEDDLWFNAEIDTSISGNIESKEEITQTTNQQYESKRTQKYQENGLDTQLYGSDRHDTIYGGNVIYENLKIENDLLIIQIHQIQEELEYYFKMYHENHRKYDAT